MNPLFRRRPRPATLAPHTAGTPRLAQCGAAVALPAGFGPRRSQSDARTLTTLRRFTNTVMPAVAARTVEERVHGGSDDLLIWPPSAAELALAGEWLNTGSPDVRDDLYAVAQSEDRAGAICEKAYIDQRATAADELLARAFGQVRT